MEDYLTPDERRLQNRFVFLVSATFQGSPANTMEYMIYIEQEMKETTSELRLSKSKTTSQPE